METKNYVNLIKQEQYERLITYYELISNKKLKFDDIEDKIYPGLTDKQKFKIEINKINEVILKDKGLLYEYYDIYEQIKYDKTLIDYITMKKDELKEEITILELCLEIPIGFYSTIPSIVEKLKTMNRGDINVKRNRNNN